MAKEVLSTRIDAALKAKLLELCAATKREPAYHVERALRAYIEDNLWHVESIHEGIKDAEANNLTSLGEARETLKKMFGNNSQNS